MGLLFELVPLGIISCRCIFMQNLYIEMTAGRKTSGLPAECIGWMGANLHLCNFRICYWNPELFFTSRGFVSAEPCISTPLDSNCSHVTTLDFSIGIQQYNKQEEMWFSFSSLSVSQLPEYLCTENRARGSLPLVLYVPVYAFLVLAWPGEDASAIQSLHMRRLPSWSAAFGWLQEMHCNFL